MERAEKLLREAIIERLRQLLLHPEKAEEERQKSHLLGSLFELLSEGEEPRVLILTESELRELLKSAGHRISMDLAQLLADALDRQRRSRGAKGGKKGSKLAHGILEAVRRIHAEDPSIKPTGVALELRKHGPGQPWPVQAGGDEYEVWCEKGAHDEWCVKERRHPDAPAASRKLSHVSDKYLRRVKEESSGTPHS